MRDERDETVEIYRIFGDFLHEVPEAEAAVRKAWRIARMREARERTVECGRDPGLDQPDSGT